MPKELFNLILLFASFYGIFLLFYILKKELRLRKIGRNLGPIKLLKLCEQKQFLNPECKSLKIVAKMPVTKNLDPTTRLNDILNLSSEGKRRLEIKKPGENCPLHFYNPNSIICSNNFSKELSFKFVFKSFSSLIHFVEVANCQTVESLILNRLMFSSFLKDKHSLSQSPRHGLFPYSWVSNLKTKSITRINWHGYFQTKSAFIYRIANLPTFFKQPVEVTKMAIYQEIEDFENENINISVEADEDRFVLQKRQNSIAPVKRGGMNKSQQVGIDSKIYHEGLKQDLRFQWGLRFCENEWIFGLDVYSDTDILESLSIEQQENQLEEHSEFEGFWPIQKTDAPIKLTYIDEMGIEFKKELDLPQFLLFKINAEYNRGFIVSCLNQNGKYLHIFPEAKILSESNIRFYMEAEAVNLVDFTAQSFILEKFESNVLEISLYSLDGEKLSIKCFKSCYDFVGKRVYDFYQRPLFFSNPPVLKDSSKSNFNGIGEIIMGKVDQGSEKTRERILPYNLPELSLPFAEENGAGEYYLRFYDNNPVPSLRKIIDSMNFLYMDGIKEIAINEISWPGKGENSKPFILFDLKSVYDFKISSPEQIQIKKERFEIPDAFEWSFFQIDCEDRRNQKILELKISTKKIWWRKNSSVQTGKWQREPLELFESDFLANSKSELEMSFPYAAVWKVQLGFNLDYSREFITFKTDSKLIINLGDLATEISKFRGEDNLELNCIITQEKLFSPDLCVSIVKFFKVKKLANANTKAVRKGISNESAERKAERKAKTKELSERFTQPISILIPEIDTKQVSLKDEIKRAKELLSDTKKEEAHQLLLEIKDGFFDPLFQEGVEIIEIFELLSLSATDENETVYWRDEELKATAKFYGQCFRKAFEDKEYNKAYEILMDELEIFGEKFNFEAPPSLTVGV